MKQATFPAIMALTATLARSAFLLGAIAPRAPSWIPIDPKLLNPHNAYVVIAIVRPWKEEKNGEYQTRFHILS